MQEHCRKFYRWGYEDDESSPEESREFGAAWSRLLGVDKFVAIPFPRTDEISVRATHAATLAKLMTPLNSPRRNVWRASGSP
jgi:alkyldihydroxyacetonephosphate synthase